MDDLTPTVEVQPIPEAAVSRRPVEPLVVVVASTMMTLTLVLMFLTRKHLRAKQISPASSPVRVE
jgi:hypothetical protein